MNETFSGTEASTVRRVIVICFHYMTVDVLYIELPVNTYLHNTRRAKRKKSENSFERLLSVVRVGRVNWKLHMR